MDTNKLAEILTEQEALELHYEFARKFGWAGTLYVREDASNAWHDDDLALTDAEWEAVTLSNSWSRMEEYLSEASYYLVSEAIKEAKENLGEYTVWVGGVEVNSHLLTQAKARALAKRYLADGYEDIQVVNTTTNIVLMKYEWSR
jgi:hypothetical protein